ncbi:dense granule protein GRA1 [Besnoitia besnoiti]|uniref:Dense granule protein GRA1 n=1 Tax=Besnoitia besnoiti TaxID=94643 RepID=A0A2A9MIA1_BESBE|nr:dense granule protein GRA1 [Besnoitia besnoiti]PFH35686.1 dense granule protein GRA1 [Besnoitia besnoiti]
MVRVSTLVGAAASVVLCLSAGAYAAGGEDSPAQRFDPSTLLGPLGSSEGEEFAIGKSVEFDLLGTRYTVTRSPESPDVLTITARAPDGTVSDVGSVSLAEVVDTLHHMRRDEQILTAALRKGETLEQAIGDVAEAEGFTPEETTQLEEAAAAALTIGRDEAQVLLDAEKLEEDRQKLAEDIKFLRGGSNE